MKEKDGVNKNIVVLTEFEHIIKRPTMYVGSVRKSEETLPIIGDGLIKSVNKEHSIGMYKLFDEVFSNSVDEAKRMSTPMKTITVEIGSDENIVSITDTGDGFTNGSAINKKSGLSNIETAVSVLRAGSNFDNDNISESIVGTNGFGVKLVNALSDKFEVETVNSTERYLQTWILFKSNKPAISKKTRSLKTGTRVTFTPNHQVFDNSKWDYQTIKSYLCLKKRILETESKTTNLKIDFIWDGKTENITSLLSPDWTAKTPIGEILIWEKTSESGSFSFVNSALCTGIHQKIILDRINGQLDDSLGHHFYDTLIVLNLSPGIVRFGDQNKTKFVSKREEVEPTIAKHFDPILARFFKSEVYKNIRKAVDARKKETELKKIRRDKKSIRIKQSNKYFPSASSRPETLFIVEGLSAMGSILQKREPKKEAVYALKGKIKNARSLSDLSDNREILELMQILNLDPEGQNIQCPFDRVVIATDQDPDGAHITSLLINLFYLWFPWMIKQGRIQFLETPLVTTGDKSKKYFYSLEEFKKGSGKSDKGNVRYLKGLGSLSLEDWDYVMKNKRITVLIEDKKTKYHLDMAFGKSAMERKKWLSSIV
jgi:DNA gyrase/topoisomerase IV subunit B